MNSYKLAKKILKLRGWCKGKRHDDAGHSCLVGAFEHNAGKSVHAEFWNGAPEAPILKAIVLQLFPHRLGRDQFNGGDVGPEDEPLRVIACFNNHRDTKLKDVISVLDEAAGAVA